MPNSRGSQTALFVTASVIVFVIAASVSIIAFVDDPEARIGLLSLMLSQIPITAGLLRVLVQQDKVHETAHRVEAKTDSVLNGEMDEKIKAGVRQVFAERWGDPPPRPPSKRLL